METVIYNKENAIATVGLNRPDKYNGLNMKMIEEITQIIADIKEDKSIRAVVIYGEGKGFCAGLDFGEVATNPQNIPKFLQEIEGQTANFVQQVGFGWTELEVPVIAALHGPVFGGGLQIALGADIRIAEPSAQLSVMEIKWGLIPDMSITTTLLDLVSLDRAKELTWTGRKVSAEESQSIGLITQIADNAKETALDLARELTQKSPDAISAGKTLMQQAKHLESKDRLKLESDIQKTLLGQANQMEAMQANFMKRPADFKDRK